MFVTSNNDLKDNELKGVLYTGYGHTWNVLYLGLEGFVSLSKYTMKSSATGGLAFNSSGSVITDATETNTSVKLNPVEYGIDLRPGFLLTPTTLFYARIGMAFNELTLDSNATGFSVGGTEPFSMPFFLSDSKNVVAWRLGGGIEQYITQHLAIRADYIYTHYGDISVNGTSPTEIVQGGNESSVTISNNITEVSNNTVLLGLSYYFPASDEILTRVCCCDDDFFNSFYLGISGGGSFTTAEENTAVTSSDNYGFLFQVPFTCQHRSKTDPLTIKPPF